MPRYRRFADASVSERILDTMFLVAMAIGYIFAMLHLYFTHQNLDGRPGLSVDDVRIAYYGSEEQTRLGAAIRGPMSGRLPNDLDKIAIFDWIGHGAPREDYERKIRPILERHCTVCHSPASGLEIPHLTSYEEVKALTRMDTGASIQGLVRVSHIHMFGIAFLLYLVGRIFILCEVPVMFKRTLVAIPFLTMITDIIGWFITKYEPGFAYVVVASGALMGASFMLQILISLGQMWGWKPRAAAVEG